MEAANESAIFARSRYVCRESSGQQRGTAGARDSVFSMDVVDQDILPDDYSFDGCIDSAR